MNNINQQDKTLLPFVGSLRKNQPLGIQMRLNDYLKLVDSTGRILIEDKRGFIDSNFDKILQRLDIDSDKWLEMAKDFEGCFSSFVGSEKHLRFACEHLQYHRPPGLASCKRIFH